MRNIAALLAVSISPSVFAQPVNAPAKPNQGEETIELRGVDQMPMKPPAGELEKMRRDHSHIASDGFSRVEKAPEIVRGFHNRVSTAKAYLARQGQSNSRPDKNERVPEVHKDLSTIKLAFKAALFDKGRLVAVALSGTKVNDAWTGVDRFFEIDGVGTVRLSEVDLAASGGTFYMAKEAINTRVHGQPAISMVFTDDQGQEIEEVLWVEGKKLNRLTFAPTLTSGSKAKAAAQITAHTLAQELH